MNAESDNNGLVLRAMDFTASNGDIIASAERLAKAVHEAWGKDARSVQLDFRSFPGGTSSYFTLLLKRLALAPRVAELINDDKALVFGTAFQRSLFERSRAAVFSNLNGL